MLSPDNSAFSARTVLDEESKKAAPDRAQVRIAGDGAGTRSTSDEMIIEVSSDSTDDHP